MKSSRDFWCIETVGKGLYKLTVYGKDPVSQISDRGAAEILLDDDDIDELVFSAHKAQRTKVTIG